MAPRSGPVHLGDPLCTNEGIANRPFGQIPGSALSICQAKHPAGSDRDLWYCPQPSCHQPGHSEHCVGTQGIENSPGPHIQVLLLPTSMTTATYSHSCRQL
jgi:hypothetical protein